MLWKVKMEKWILLCLIIKVEAVQLLIDGVFDQLSCGDDANITGQR